MKHSLRYLICASLMLTLIASCGKDKSSGGGTAAAEPVVAPVTTVNPVVDPNADQATQLVNLQAWYAALDTVSIGSAGDFKRKTSSFNSTGFSFKFSFKVNSTYKPTHCYLGSASTQVYMVGTPNSGRCENSVDGSKANNLKLKRAINGEDGALKLIYIQTSGTKYVLYYGQNISNSYVQPQTVLVHVIDTSVHSLFNPVQTVDLRTSQEDYIESNRITLQ